VLAALVGGLVIFPARCICYLMPEILVANADRLPRQFGVALRNVVAERAPQVPDVKELAGQFDWARQTSWSVITSSYSVRDERGHPLR
jgi:hypothetical protein